MLRIVLLTLFVACASAAAIEGEETKVEEIKFEDIKDINDFSIVAPDGSTFRFDYTYHDLAGGWLKLHRTTASWTIARLACRLEGARLASPIDASLYSTMTEMFQQSTLRSVFTGVSALSISSDFTSVEGVHITQMPLVWKNVPVPSTNESRLCLAMTREGQVYQTSCEKEQPFFCYKERDRAQMNYCGTTDPGYVRSFETGSCYKVHRNLATWFQAQTTCAAEGGHLVIINDVREAQVVSDMARGVAEYLSVGMVNWYQYDHFDIHTWRTVDGQTLEEAGYANWQPGEPNNEGDGEHCGSICWVNNQIGFNDNSCASQVPFVCEITRPRVPVWW